MIGAGIGHHTEKIIFPQQQGKAGICFILATNFDNSNLSRENEKIIDRSYIFNISLALKTEYRFENLNLAKIQFCVGFSFLKYCINPLSVHYLLVA